MGTGSGSPAAFQNYQPAISLSAKEQDGKSVCITIHDNGVGIEEGIVGKEKSVDNLLRAIERSKDNDIDRLITTRRPEGPGVPEELPKGMNRQTLLTVREWLSENRGESFSSEQIAASVGLSRITIRRYVSYLAERGELESRIDYKTGGRPGILYRYGGS